MSSKKLSIYSKNLIHRKISISIDLIGSNLINIIQTKLNQLRYLIDTKVELYDKKIYIKNINDSIEELDFKKFIDNLSKI